MMQNLMFHPNPPPQATQGPRLQPQLIVMGTKHCYVGWVRSCTNFVHSAPYAPIDAHNLRCAQYRQTDLLNLFRHLCPHNHLEWPRTRVRLGEETEPWDGLHVC